MKNRKDLFTKLFSRSFTKWWILLTISLGFLIFGIILAIYLKIWVDSITDKKLILRKGSPAFDWWAKPPVVPVVKIYIYNVTNANDILNNGSKPIVNEIGPYVYFENWEKKNIQFNENSTVTFNQEKLYCFAEELSAGLTKDVVVVPNIPMLTAVSQAKHAERFIRLGLSSIMDMLKIKPFVTVTVEELLWGYEDPLLKIAKDLKPEGQKIPPSDKFGLMYNKNGTSEDIVTMFTGAGGLSKYGLIDKYNGMSKLPYYKTDKCNSLMGSDGSIFPPHITKETTLYIYNKDLCRLLPLIYEQEFTPCNDIPIFRFTPPENVFDNPKDNPENDCFCPDGPPCAPSGFFNVSLCQYNSPILLSFPHFYLADFRYRTAVEGISPPDPEMHQFYIDVQPAMGIAMSAKARLQVNLAVSPVRDIKQVAKFPDIIFPIIWFEEGIDYLPEEMTEVIYFATQIPSILRMTLSTILILVGAVLFLTAIWGLVNGVKTLTPLQVPRAYEASGKINKPEHVASEVDMSNVPNS